MSLRDEIATYTFGVLAAVKRIARRLWCRLEQHAGVCRDGAFRCRYCAYADPYSIDTYIRNKLDHAIASRSETLEEVLGKDWVIVEAFCDGDGGNGCYVRVELSDRLSSSESSGAFGATIAEAAKRAIARGVSEFEMTGGS